MNIFFTTITEDPSYETPLGRFRELAQRDRIGQHRVVDSAEKADLVLFVDVHQQPNDWALKRLRSHPVVQQYRHKCIIYDERDRPCASLPGLYVCLPKSYFDARRHRACAYYTTQQEYAAALPLAEADLLYSFLGAPSHPVRLRLLSITHPRAVLELTSAKSFADVNSDESRKHIEFRRQNFNNIMRRSKFVLCPRGHGTSSFRLFETLACGRVPVIIGNEWVAPTGPEWNTCTLRVREQDIGHIPQLLEKNEHRFEAMAQAARETYETWFSPEVTFHRFAEMGQSLIESGATRHATPRLSLMQQLRTPFEQSTLAHKVMAKSQNISGKIQNVLQKKSRDSPHTTSK